MITEQALNEAIAEVQGKRDPNRSDCMMLAAFYIIQDRLYPQQSDEASGYSFAQPSEAAKTPDFEWRDHTVGEYGDSDFLRTIAGRDAEQCWKVMDDLMNTLWAINPRLYAGTIRELNK